MKGTFLVKRARPDLEPGFVFLSSRVRASMKQDWSKLVKIMSFVLGTKDKTLMLSADDSHHLHCHVDAAFGVHPDMKSHTSGVFSMGFGAMLSSSTKQKANPRSSMEAELIAIDDKTSKVAWSKRFTEVQGFKVNLNIVFQDNMSAIKFIENGKLSSGKITRHFDIRMFHVTDLISRKKVSIKHCPTGKMFADHLSKPLVGKLSHTMRSNIMNISFRE